MSDQHKVEERGWLSRGVILPGLVSVTTLAVAVVAAMAKPAIPTPATVATVN